MDSTGKENKFVIFDSWIYKEYKIFWGDFGNDWEVHVFSEVFQDCFLLGNEYILWNSSCITGACYEL